MTGIRLHAITKSYRQQTVLSGVDLTVPQGSMLALLGPSGSGKTTLLRLIAGFERADGGEIHLGSSVMQGKGRFVPPERRNVGYVPQEGALFPHLTVARNVGYGLRHGQLRRPRVDEVLRLVDLTDYADRYPHELSGGQQQRVALARAMAPHPRVILLDEPFNALDLDLRRKMSEHVVALLRQAGTTTVLVTHDPAEAFAAADLVAVINNGVVMQCGTPTEVYNTPANAEVARLTGMAILLDGVMRKSKAETLIGAIPVAGHPEADGGKVTVLLRPEQIELAHASDGREAAILNRHFQGDHTVLTLSVDDLEFDVRTDAPPSGKTVWLKIRGSCQTWAR
ncbi:ABC transporter ATP-binding protein [Pseudorhodoplanes sp.]|uniref:ABC transporter ATP-binding protein n=1 Tax=Pseudorhodoplanes sp. TaxID=1934341 RepID=UPI003D119CAE